MRRDAMRREETRHREAMGYRPLRRRRWTWMWLEDAGVVAAIVVTVAAWAVAGWMVFLALVAK